MTKLKFNLLLGDDCTLEIQDVTGFNQTTGFITETSPDIPIDSYKLTSGYFKNVILYNKYGTLPVIVNPREAFRKIDNVEDVYEDNFPIERYTLTQDGVFTIKRVFIMSEEFYNLYQGTNRFTDRIVYYTNGSLIYRIEEGVAKIVTISDFIGETDLATGSISSLTLVSTCLLNDCYYNIIRSLITKGLTVCDDALSTKYMEERDFIYMVLEAIKYLKEESNVVEIQKMIEAVNLCGGVCKSLMTNDCGCNG